MGLRTKKGGETLAGKGKKENLKPFQSVDAVECGRKGGIASGEARRKKKAIREWVEAIGETAPPKALADEFKKNSLKIPKDMTLDGLVVRSMYIEAANGNVQAFKALADVQNRQAEVKTGETPDTLSNALMSIAEELNNE